MCSCCIDTPSRGKSWGEIFHCIEDKKIIIAINVQYLGTDAESSAAPYAGFCIHD
jgi:hypothetical protein